MRAELLLGLALLAIGVAGCTSKLPSEAEATAPAAPAPTAPPDEPASPSAAPAKVELSAYASPKDGWRVQYPAGWVHTSLAGITAFASPGNTPDRPGASINVVVSPAAGATLADSVNTTLGVLPRIMTDFHLVESRPDTLGTVDAHRWTYTARQGEFTLRLTQVLALHAGKGFVLTFGSAQERAADFADLWGPVQASFQFTDLPVPASGERAAA